MRQEPAPDNIADTIRDDAINHAEPPAILCALICETLDDNLAQDITTINLAEQSVIADYMVIATGRNNRHLGALATHLKEQLKAAGFANVKSEGEKQNAQGADWILVDAGDVVVHLFRAERREHYALEKLWGNP